MKQNQYSTKIHKSAVDSTADYDSVVGELKETGDDLAVEAYKLFNNALIGLLKKKGPTILLDMEVTPSSVSEKLNDYIECNDNVFSIESLMDITIRDYIRACSEKEIRYHLKYMMACLWSAMQKGKTDILAEAAFINNTDERIDYITQKIIDRFNRWGQSLPRSLRKKEAIDEDNDLFVLARKQAAAREKRSALLKANIE
ncbi:MAG: hypothetical protein FWG21_03205 [Oscillospiraceae bacterium]|nr:hypothetical protein [Oscillospiraceae bacterium]